MYKTNNAMFGRLYRYITLMLGLSQHEYKVMGLAPTAVNVMGKNPMNTLNHFMF